MLISILRLRRTFFTVGTLWQKADFMTSIYIYDISYFSRRRPATIAFNQHMSTFRAIPGDHEQGTASRIALCWYSAQPSVPNLNAQSHG